MVLATVQDVSDRMMRPLTAPEEQAANAYIAELSAAVQERYAGVDAAVAERPSYRDVVAGRIANAVARVLRNPEGYVSEAIDDWSGRRSDASGLYLSADDWDAILPPAAAGLSSAYVVSLWG